MCAVIESIASCCLSVSAVRAVFVKCTSEGAVCVCMCVCFPDGAMSLGCSIIVHCAAGISRSPALAVAYVMYSLGMDLDHAYR